MIARSKTTKEHKAHTIIRNSMQCVSIHKMLQNITIHWYKIIVKQ